MRLRLAAIALLVAAPLAGQTGAAPYDFAAYAPYRAGVPNPEALLGHAIGSRHTIYGQQQQVLDALIAAAGEAGTAYLLVEQDICKGPAIDAVTLSYNNLKAKGYA